MKLTNQNLRSASEGEGATENDSRNAVVMPAMGLNDNLEFMGKLLHVQTESKGTALRCILTQVFSNGRVVFSTKTEVPAYFCETSDHSKIRDLMQAQHFHVMQKIRDKQASILDKP